MVETGITGHLKKLEELIVGLGGYVLAFNGWDLQTRAVALRAL